jgi:hypothetical protein
MSKTPSSQTAKQTVQPTAQPAAHSPAVDPKRRKLLRAIEAIESASASQVQKRIALAEAYFRLAVLPGADLEEAVDFLEKAYQLDPQHPKLAYHLGRLAHLMGDFPSAARHYRQALRLSPENQRAAAHLGLALLEGGNAEKEIGQSLLDALGRGQPTGVKESLSALDELLAGGADGAMGKNDVQAGAGGGAKPGAPALRPSRSGEKGYAPENIRWKAIWKTLAAEQISRPAPDLKALKEQFQPALKEAREDNISAAAILCAVMLLDPAVKPVALELAEAQPFTAHDGHPALILLQHALQLARCDAPAQALELAEQMWRAEKLPEDYLVAFLYALLRPESGMAAAQALSLLETVHSDLHQREAFKELRLALLDGHANRASNRAAYDEAHLLWRAALELAPARVNLAHNLALLAARTRDVDHYPRYWNMAAELRYLLAAAANNPHVHLKDRIALHKGFVQQSYQSCLNPEKRIREQKPEAVSKWMADRLALTTWMEEWELYYLNARLQYRSAVHLLGVSRDASPELVDAAAQALQNLVERALKPKNWAGAQAFSAMTVDAVQNAAALAKDDAKKARDPHYDPEKASATELVHEAIEHGFGLFHLLQQVKSVPGGGLELGMQIGAHLMALPWKILQPVCIARGYIGEDDDLEKIFTSYLLEMVMSAPENGGGSPGGATASTAEMEKKLQAMDAMAAWLPGQPLLAYKRGELLFQLKRYDECYRLAVASLESLAASKGEAEEDGNLQAAFAELIEGAALHDIPEHIFQPSKKEDMEAGAKLGQERLESYPHSAQLHLLAATRMLFLAKDEPDVQKVVELLKDGLKNAFTPRQREQLENSLEEAQGRLKTIGVSAEISRLLEEAAHSVQECIASVQQGRISLQDAAKTVDKALATAEKARKQAEKHELESELEQAQGLISQLQELKRKFNR